MIGLVEQCVPAGRPCTAGELIADVTAEPPGGRLVVGDERVHTFLGAVGRRLLRPSVARRHPELAALGWFLRPGALAGALDGLAERPGRLVFPRGLVFHVTPSNVDTMLGYSWALSALAGNANVVRVSPRAGAVAHALLAVLADAAREADPAVVRTQRMVRYGRDDAVTAALSDACDLRVVWGGDAAVRDIRRYPLRPAARDLTFPDRSSFAVVSATGWLAATPGARQAAVRGFHRDAFWFDQAACASPRAVFWIGAQEQATRARADFHALLAGFVARHGPRVDAAMAIEQRVAAYGLAADGVARAVRFDRTALATVELTAPALLPRRWLGLGTLVEARLDRFADLAPLVNRRDQTVTHFGFDPAEVVGFARLLAGRGVDRLVPVGEALTFHEVWDGYDLLHEYTRFATVSFAGPLPRQLAASPPEASASPPEASASPPEASASPPEAR